MFFGIRPEVNERKGNGLAAQFSELIEILEKERVILGQIEQMLASENKCLSTFDRKGLDGCNTKLENLSMQMDILEQSRLELIHELSQMFGMPEDKASLSALAGHAPGIQGERLRQLRKSIVERTATVAKLQQGNRVLIVNGLKMINGVRKIMEDSVEPQVTYAPTGMENEHKASLATGRRI